jgi:hypothetical protein
MNRERSKIRSSHGGLNLVELPEIPHDRSEIMPNKVAALTGESAAYDKNARVLAKAARLDSFFNARDAHPTGSRIGEGGRAQLECMAIRVGLDDCEKLNMRAREAGKKSIVVF